jgi:DSF synthase
MFILGENLMRILMDGNSYNWPVQPHNGAPLLPPRFAPPAPVSARAPAVKLAEALGALDLVELKLEIDVDVGAVWCFQQHLAGGSFAPRLLNDIRAVQRALQDFHRNEPASAAEVARFLIWASGKSGIFNLGGDLKYFEHLVTQRDYGRLKAYALCCIDVCFMNYSALHSPMLVGALVAGDALGGGMESALSCDFILAEEQAKFGLPEMLYGLFPGMGAYSFLMRRVGQARAETFILEGNLHSAAELHALQLVDRVVAPGAGRFEMDRHLAKLSRRFNATLAMYNARRRSFPIAYQEMADIAEEWVSVALRLSHTDLRRMQKLAAAQGNRLRSAAARDTTF